jgi:hypothetical protein
MNIMTINKTMKKMALLGVASCISVTAFADSFVNLRQHPGGLFSETLDLNLDFYINNAWSAGPSIRFTNHDEDGNGRTGYPSFDLLAMKLGIQANYAWDQNIHDSGWLLSSKAFAGYRNTYTTQSAIDCIDYCPTTQKVDEKIWSGGVEVLQSYQFIWGDFFNLNLGYGAMMTVGDEETSQLKGLALGFHPSAEFSIGWRL